MRNISFSLTTPQFKNRSKTVTRRAKCLYLPDAVEAGRIAWALTNGGTLECLRLMGCEKCMGRKKGEPLMRLGAIVVTDARREPLRRMTDEPEYGKAECIKEGFPDMTPEEFVAFFCRSHKGITPDSLITRIKFRYL